MLKKNNFFHNYFPDSSDYKKNLKKTRILFNHFLSDLKNNQIPLLESYKKNYDLSFSKQLVKKFSKFKNIIVIGMGGSILGTKCIYSFLNKKIKKNLFFFDNLDLNLNARFKKIKNLHNSCFVIISKSGNTLETLSNVGSIFSKKIFKNRIIVVTEIKDNAIMSLANKFNAEVIQHHEFISGRYSVLSEAGMITAALMGLNTIKFKNLEKFLKNKNFVKSLIKNVASIHTLNLKGFKNSVILSYDSDLNDLSYWYQQLVAESLGKGGKGINPIVSFAPKDHHSLLQLYLDGPKDKFFTFLGSSQKQKGPKISEAILSESMHFLKNKNLGFVINAQSRATKNIFKLKKIPFRQINFVNKNEEKLGEVFTFFVLETILLARLMKVDPFNQPAVEQVKIETKKFLL